MSSRPDCNRCGEAITMGSCKCGTPHFGPLPDEYHIVQRHDDNDTAEIYYEIMNYASEAQIYVHGPNAKTVAETVCARMNQP